MALMTTRARSSGQLNYIRFALRLRLPLAIATMVFAAFGLAANYFQVDLALRPLDGRAATHPITAACLFGLGFAVFRLNRFGPPLLVRSVIGGLIIAVCAMRLMQNGLGQVTGAPPLAMFGPVGPFTGWFSIESAVTIGAFAVASVLRRGLSRWGIVFLVVGLATVFNTLLQISYGLTFFNEDIGAFSVLALVCMAVAMTTAYIHRPFIRVGFLAGNIGHQTRVMAMAAIAVPWACGAFLHSVRDIDATAVPYEAAMVSIIIGSMLMILFTTASHLENSDVARRRAERDIALMNRIDPTTKALNRFGLSERLDAAWVAYKTSGTQYGMLLLDVDYFRRLNDTFGNGGEVLESVTATIQNQLRDHDAVGHWGSDEFLILLKIKARDDLNIVADRLRVAFADAQSTFATGLTGDPIAINATFGHGVMRDEDQSSVDMIVRAEAALQVAKELGGGQSPVPYSIGDDADPLDFAETSVKQGDLAA